MCLCLCEYVCKPEYLCMFVFMSARTWVYICVWIRKLNYVYVFIFVFVCIFSSVYTRLRNTHERNPKPLSIIPPALVCVLKPRVDEKYFEPIATAEDWSRPLLDRSKSYVSSSWSLWGNVGYSRSGISHNKQLFLLRFTFFLPFFSACYQLSFHIEGCLKSVQLWKLKGGKRVKGGDIRIFFLCYSSAISTINVFRFFCGKSCWFTFFF